MNKRDVIGKRIVRLIQQPDVSAAGSKYKHLDAIVLEDGTEIQFVVMELETGDYGLRAFVVKPKAG